MLRSHRGHLRPHASIAEPTASSDQVDKAAERHPRLSARRHPPPRVRDAASSARSTSSYGFEPLETPAFENIETLLGKYGEEGNKLIFKILRRGEHEGSGEADLALRYDLTVPLARVVAQYQNELPRFFKRYQIQPVWRADRPARGRFREFYQCDIDAIGSTSPVVEAELLAAVSEVLTRLGFDDFVVRLNHRRVLTALLECAGMPETQHARRAGGARQARQDWHRRGRRRSCAARGIDRGRSLACLRLSERRAPTTGRRRRCRSSGSRDVVARVTRPGRRRRRAAIRSSSSADGTPARGRIRIDPASRAGCHTTPARSWRSRCRISGSLGGGGRYDNLVGMFLGRDVPACGFSLGLERIIVVMTERDMFPAKVSRGAVDVMVDVPAPTSCARDALQLAAELRAEKLRVEVYPEASRKLDKPLKYAVEPQRAGAGDLGEDEQARGEVAVSDLQTAAAGGAPRRMPPPAWIAKRVRIDR